MNKPEQEKKEIDFRLAYYRYGLELSITSSGEFLGVCPACDKEKFYVNPNTGLYSCRVCHDSGNFLTFLRNLHGLSLEETENDDYKSLSENRNIETKILKHYEVAQSIYTGQWLIPMKNADGAIINLFRFDPNAENPKYKFLGASGMTLAMFGIDKLSSGKKKTLWVVEGYWDYLLMNQVLDTVKMRAKNEVIGLPGTFKKTWTKDFKGRTVHLLMDHDNAGRNLTKRVAKLCVQEKHAPERMTALKWAEDVPDKYDIRDHFQSFCQ